MISSGSQQSDDFTQLGHWFPTCRVLFYVYSSVQHGASLYKKFSQHHCYVFRELSPVPFTNMTRMQEITARGLQFAFLIRSIASIIFAYVMVVKRPVINACLVSVPCL